MPKKIIFAVSLSFNHGGGGGGRQYIYFVKFTISTGFKNRGYLFLWDHVEYKYEDTEVYLQCR